MARGKLPEQAPYIDDATLFFAINAVYLYLAAFDKDVKVLEAGPSGTFTTVDGKTITVVKGRITSIV